MTRSNPATLLLLVLMLLSASTGLFAEAAAKALKPASPLDWNSLLTRADVADTKLLDTDKKEAAAIAALSKERDTSLAAALVKAEGDALTALRKRFMLEVVPRYQKKMSALMEGELPKSAEDAKKLSALVVHFHKAWRTVFMKGNEPDMSANDTLSSAIRRYLAIADISDFADRPTPYEGFTNDAQRDAFIAVLKRVAAFIPDQRTAKYFSADKEDAKQVAIFDAATKEGEPLAIRSCVTSVVFDLNQAYGDLTETKAVRIVVVKEYSKATTLGSTGSFATIMAIVGSLILFGGLALALFIAASKKGDAPA